MWDDKTRLVPAKRGGIVKRVFRKRCIVTVTELFIQLGNKDFRSYMKRILFNAETTKMVKITNR